MLDKAASFREGILTSGNGSYVIPNILQVVIRPNRRKVIISPLV